MACGQGTVRSAQAPVWGEAAAPPCPHLSPACFLSVSGGGGSCCGASPEVVMQASCGLRAALPPSSGPLPTSLAGTHGDTILRGQSGLRSAPGQTNQAHVSLGLRDAGTRAARPLGAPVSAQRFQCRRQLSAAGPCQPVPMPPFLT